MSQLKGNKGAAVFACITQGFFSFFNASDQYIDLLIGEIFYLDMKSALVEYSSPTPTPCLQKTIAMYASNPSRIHTLEYLYCAHKSFLLRFY
jgi:hypothetical protein